MAELQQNPVVGSNTTPNPVDCTKEQSVTAEAAAKNEKEDKKSFYESTKDMLATAGNVAVDTLGPVASFMGKAAITIFAGYFLIQGLVFLGMVSLWGIAGIAAAIWLSSHLLLDRRSHIKNFGTAENCQFNRFIDTTKESFNTVKAGVSEVCNQPLTV